MKILFKYKEIGTVTNSLEGLKLILKHNQNIHVIQAFKGNVLKLDKEIKSELDPMVVVRGFYFSKDIKGYQLKNDHLGYELEELLEDVHLYDYKVKTRENTRQEIKDKLSGLSWEELKNLNNALTSETYTDIWYYTYEELLNLHFDGDVRTFIKHLNAGYVDLEEEYLFYENVTGNSSIESISSENLAETLTNDRDEMAEFLYKYQEEAKKPAIEIIENWKKNI